MPSYKPALTRGPYLHSQWQSASQPGGMQALRLPSLQCALIGATGSHVWPAACSSGPAASPGPASRKGFKKAHKATLWKAHQMSLLAPDICGVQSGRASTSLFQPLPPCIIKSCTCTKQRPGSAAASRLRLLRSCLQATTLLCRAVSMPAVVCLTCAAAASASQQGPPPQMKIAWQTAHWERPA